MAGSRRVRHGSNYTSISSGDPSDFVGPIRDISFREWVQPLLDEFLNYRTKKWKGKNIHKDAQVIVLTDDVLSTPDQEGNTVLVGDTKPSQIRAEAVVWLSRRQPQNESQEAVHNHNLGNAKKLDYIVVNNWRQAERFFTHMKKQNLMKSGRATHRGHETAAVRLQGEAAMAKLKRTTTAQSGVTSKGLREKNAAYMAARQLMKQLQAESDSLTPSLTWETKFDIDRRTRKIKGVDHLVILAPETQASNIKGKKRKDEALHRKAMERIINKWLDKYGDYRLNVTGSKTPMKLVSQTVSDMLMDRKEKGYRLRKRAKSRVKKQKIAKPRVGAAKRPTLRTSDGKFTSPMNIQAILNAKVKEEVADNMGKGGALVYRTGRFANSVSVTKVMQSRQGALTAFYTYMKAPYQTFERGYAQGSLRRDPRKLIAASIREIARETLNHKLQIRTRRV